MTMKMKRTRLRKGKGEVSSPVVEIGLAVMDDLMFAKYPRTLSGRKKKKTGSFSALEIVAL